MGSSRILGILPGMKPSPGSKLVEAVQARDLAEVLRRIADGNLDARDERGWTAACYAAAIHADTILEPLLDADASLEHDAAETAPILVAKPRDEWKGRTTLLHVAAAFGATRCVRLLLARGVAVDGPDPAGTTPLMYAAFGAVTPFFPVLMAPDADHGAVMGALLAAGANPNAKNDGGHRAIDLLHYVPEGAFPLYGILLEAGADPNGGGGVPNDPTARPLVETLLVRPRTSADEALQVRVLERLLAAGLDPYRVAGALAAAVSAASPYVGVKRTALEALIENGPPPPPQQVLDGFAAAAELVHPAQMRVLEALFRVAPADMNLDGVLARVVHHSLEPRESKDVDHLKPRARKVIAELLSRGARPDGRVDLHVGGVCYGTALHRAAAMAESNLWEDTGGTYHGALLELLMPAVGDVDGVDRDGNTPLHVACSAGLAAHAAKLLARGADPKRKNRKGFSAYAIARGLPIPRGRARHDVLAALESIAGPDPDPTGAVAPAPAKPASPGSPKAVPAVTAQPIPNRPRVTTKPADDDDPFVVGASVKHPTFGVGTITKVDGEGDLCRLRIEFATDTKTMLAKFVVPTG